MKISTEHYSLEFPKYARKIRTKIVPSTDADRTRISHILEEAKIEYVIEESAVIGVQGRHADVVSKLKTIIRSNLIHIPEEQGIAKRLFDDIQFRALLG